jgi:hypothetical protein
VNEEIASLPRQVTRLECPIGRCPWTYDDPGPSGTAAFADVAALMTAHAMDVEGVVREHLETHPLIEWARELARVRGEKTAEIRAASATVGVLLRRLGGPAEITNAELAAEQGTLYREPTASGFRLAVA